MEEVKETKVDSQTFDEDMFSGVNDAINSTNWNDNSVRIVILVGDAPGHKLGHEWNASGMDQETLRAVADSNDVKLYAMWLKMRYRLRKYWNPSVRVIPEPSRIEIQLTDTLRLLLKERNLEAYVLKGRSLDCGSKIGYIRAFVEYAMNNEKLKDEFKDYLRKEVVPNL